MDAIGLMYDEFHRVRSILKMLGVALWYESSSTVTCDEVDVTYEM